MKDTHLASPEEAVAVAVRDEATSAAAPAGPVFASLNLAPQILDNLNRLGFVTPTPIQERAIPVVVDGKDLIGIAQTGTGKTLAFGLPILHHLLTRKNCGRALILLPTRELALQVEEAIQNIAGRLRIRSAVLIGGAPIRSQLTQLRGNPDIIVATPGRLIDHLQNGAVDLRTVDTLVLDEADRMLDMGFAPQIRQIVRATPPERQTLLFSATMPDEIVKMTREFLRNPVRIEIERPGTSAAGVSQELYVIGQEQKPDLLAKILYDNPGSVLVFTRTRSRAHRVARDINFLGIKAAQIHADRTLAQRRAALDGFKSGKYRVLVATDIAARGIDVTDITVVVNYDLPDSADDYVHRIGRTGRAGRTGHAISFAAPDQWRDVRDIEKVTSATLDFAENNQGEFEKAAFAPRSNRRPTNRRHSSSPSRGGSGGASGGRPRTSSAPRSR